MSTATSTSEDNFFKKNKRLNRPMSPHLTIYKPQLTSMMSITHRASGMILSAYAATFAIYTMSSSGTLAEHIEVWKTLPAIVPFTLKCGFIFPLYYHAINGVRHLIWDMGKGFNLPTLYKTGYTVIALSLLFGVVDLILY
ncbi:expressed hypothetical protein [Trichoplax adhaerens]|uniref:Uncharacterized protein n=1 Tax=Trichoplax adhaerens TaxID=10228 RepID=B3RU87_TRIAD|nr:expressed hypothetical protein [Trichoplax adhaerens]EDV25765.1 expressed hypothetical protein [Trichoplax adhaerens]|eukprot:XP_002111798.1 expressed hypothetical protein [Trichoplax adhaerens]